MTNSLNFSHVSGNPNHHGTISAETRAKARLCWRHSVMIRVSSTLNLFRKGILLTKKFIPFSKNVKIRIYRTVILPVVLCMCETWSLTSREEHRLRILKNNAEENVWTEEG
jgi:hypothetical protein